MANYERSEIEKLVDGKLPWSRVQEMMKDAKDEGRFETWLAILQDRVAWKERILLPLGPCLYIVEKGKERIVKCRCGQEFGDYRVNWKIEALIHVRESAEALSEVYRGSQQPDPDWIQLREYYCPGCGSQLEVEAVPRGCPPDFTFLPDLDTFYRDWLGKPLANPKEFADKTSDAMDGWPK